MATERAGGPLVKEWDGFFLRDDTEIRRSAEIEPNEAYSLFRTKPYGRVHVFAFPLEVAIALSEATILRETIIPEILAMIPGNGSHMMPSSLLPIMDCDNCLYIRYDWRDGGHCYMFRDKPDGDRCGQFKLFRS